MSTADPTTVQPLSAEADSLGVGGGGEAGAEGVQEGTVGEGGVQSDYILDPNTGYYFVPSLQVSSGLSKSQIPTF